MYNISIFAEDRTLERFIIALIERLANTYHVKINLISYSVRGGQGKVINALKKYQQDLHRNQEDLPDLIIAGTDSNCKGSLEQEREIHQAISDYTNLVISATPEPHIERWLLLDSKAFKTVFGRGCPTPDQKCEQDRYKKLFLNAIIEAGMMPPLDGTERVADLVNEMDLQRISQMDKSIDRFLSVLQRRFKIWQQMGV
ncbi:hypothetical protein C6501_06995 [Candidatus Poribacteria bacterium]|nr:MAG: hypothetical protein C6501_06995 [Candidatus Poribacteria bacterium]